MVDISTPQFLELLRIISGQRYTYYTEMHHCRAIMSHADHLDRFLGPPHSNVVVQLGGSSVEDMAMATKILQDQGYAEVNINNGCPSPNVQHGSFGAVLMKTPQLVADMLTAMDRLHVTLPVTVKCRIGVDHQESEEFLFAYLDTLLTQTTKPPPHLIVHARKCILKGLSPKQNRTIPPLNYDRVFQLAKAYPDLIVSINGGFDQVDSIQNALDQVDGCMIGRKVMDDPLFLQTLDYAFHPQHQQKSVEQITQEYLDYADRIYSIPLQAQDYGHPPPTLMIRPLTTLFKGRTGRQFRREIQKQLKADTPTHLFHSIVKHALHQSKL
ncbi:tRNA-dihydrouridine synthase [Choanephora cucurbitarum]|nr:tRNA-dihydrouridine synthase [Choanephora cucurbitarum]